MKTLIARYLKRSNKDATDYIEVKDSASVVEFCKRHISSPSSKTGIKKRFFTNILPAVFLERKEEAADKVKTLAGISTKYQYICEVIRPCQLPNIIFCVIGGWLYQVAQVSLLLRGLH